MTDRGFVLVLVLFVLAILMALVVEFSYGVYATTSNMMNWAVSQRMTLLANSGIRLASVAITEQARLTGYRYTYPDRIEIPIEKIVDGVNGKVHLRVVDEGGKINLNALITRNKRLNMDVYNSLRRLMGILRLKEEIADRIVDWIDEDSEPRVRDSEDNAKNSPFDSLDELLLITDIDRETYDKLTQHVTIYGVTDRMSININTASIPVIMSLDEMITEEMADSIVKQRRFKPFEGTDDPDLTRILGPLKGSLMGKIDVRSNFFHVTSIAEQEGIKRVIDSVLEMRGDVIVRYWKEY